ncbi:MAG: alanine dehydrogenase [Capsulimonadaceae bacterium]|nr:alanine dehydrogenase [Capsulimonadaceae bacterium]
MIVGVPKEIKDNENRVALAPSGAEILSSKGHLVVVESGAGLGTGITDAEFEAAGARIASVSAVWGQAEIIVKVKEPISVEWPSIRPGQTLFTYFHFAASEALTRAMLASGATCIAYETVEDLAGRSLPLLTPMSEIAGKMAVQEAAKYLERPQGGRGILLGGVPGVLPAHVVILGGGVVGINAAKIASGMGANVTIFDIDLDRLRYLDDVLPANVTTYFSNPAHIRDILPTADVVIGAVLIPGARTPILVRETDLSRMKPGSVIIDVAVDQGGCVETMHPTTHAIPIFTVDDVVHYGVANIPGAVPATSTYALTNATFPYVLSLADRGVRPALASDHGLARGLGIAAGQCYRPEIAQILGLPQAPAAAFWTAP